MNLITPIYIFITLYIIAILYEAIFSHHYGKGFYDFRDTLMNLGLGAMAVLLRMLTKGMWLTMWIYLYQFAPIKITEHLWSWILLFFSNEFVYYWFHG